MNRPNDPAPQPRPSPTGPPSTAGGKARIADFWLDGGVLACACPDCGAPMSIRLWLMTADCWRCGASVELTEEQQRRAERLLEEYRSGRAASSASPSVSSTQTAGRKTQQPVQSAPQPQSPPGTAPNSKAAVLPSRKPSESRASPAEGIPPSPPQQTLRAAQLKHPQGNQPQPNPTELPPASQAGATPYSDARPTMEAKPSDPSSVQPTSAQKIRVRRRVPAALIHRSARERLRRWQQDEGLRGLSRRLIGDLPAWLVSLVFHAVLIILLGLWLTPQPEHRGIILATAISPQDYEGEQGRLSLDEKAFEFDEPGAIDFPSSLQSLGIGDIEPPTPPTTPPIVDFDPVGLMPERVKTFSSAEEPTPPGRMFLGRDPQLRAQLVRSSGGTSATEAAVARGLKFLDRHQHPNGGWSLMHFRTEDCDDTCSHSGGYSSRVAGTALALLPFLGAGQTHTHGEYQEVVLRALNTLLSYQSDDGDLRRDCDGRMYAQGIATIALCEAYALTRDKQLREPAQRALNFIVAAQHSEGGWRYEPGEPGDVSVVGWQLMALTSGRMAGLHVPDYVFERAAKFLDTTARKDKSQFGTYNYMPHVSTTIAMTAEALLCRQYLGCPRDDRELMAGVELMLRRFPPDERRPNVYYWYYATQVLHHYGGVAWKQWNERMRQILVSTQEIKGHAAGSWTPQGVGIEGGFANNGGRIYMTALCLCTLEVYYRHLPLYHETAIEGLLPRTAQEPTPTTDDPTIEKLKTEPSDTNTVDGEVKISREKARLTTPGAGTGRAGADRAGGKQRREATNILPGD